jgi:hypothetical protein
MQTLPSVQLFPREQFLAERWAYKAGQHVTFLAPTQSGKTTLMFELLQRTARPKTLPAVVLVMKPRDKTVKEWVKRLHFRTVRSWPPLPSLYQPQPPGWALWPKHSFDPDKDDEHLYREFRRAILDSYKRGDRILAADETYGLSAELKLTKELISVWSRGASMGTGLWAASQKPTHIPLWAYSQAEHLFIWHDPDRRARDRFAEIGGVDPDLVDETVKRLAKHQALYIRRSGPALCVVDA